LFLGSSGDFLVVEKERRRFWYTRRKIYNVFGRIFVGVLLLRRE
jgi:hypothetical protein